MRRSWWGLRPVSRGTFRVSLALYLLVRIYLGAQPGYLWDTEGYIKGWALASALNGISETYETSNFDYPPLFLYLLQPVGKLYLALHPELLTADIGVLPWDELVFRLPGGQTYRSKWKLWSSYPGRQFEADPLPDYALFTFLSKAPALLFDFVLAAILYGLVAFRATWGDSRAGPAWGRLAAMAYLWNPMVLLYSAYGGTPDSIHSALMLACLALLGVGRLAASSVSLSAAGMMKPLAAPLVPLLAIAAAARSGIRGVLVSGAAGLVTAILIFAPFLLAGKGSVALDRVLGDIDAMPFTSVNAHNLWWFFGGWENANAPIFVGITPKAIGISLFLIAYAALVIKNRSWLSGEGATASAHTGRLMLLAAAITASFFYLSTHMHENHLFVALPLLLVIAGRSSSLGYVVLAVTVVSTLNGLLHDMDAPYLIPFVNAPSTVGNPQIPGIPYTWVQLVGSYANAVATSATVAWIVALAWRIPRELSED